jgi:hypothetical protein
MMAMITPSYEGYAESVSTLKFATRAKKIKNEAWINEDVDHKALLRKYENELKKLRKQLSEKNNEMMYKEELLRLEQDKRESEENKETAIIALESKYKEYLQEKEVQIKQLTSQLLVGGQIIEDTPQFRSALETKHKIIREEYDEKLLEIEKERQMIEADKAQVDRYKQLLLKQRDIMLALTARINERDDTIIQLQEELDAIEHMNKNNEINLNQSNNKIYKLIKLLKEKGVPDSEIDTDSEDEYFRDQRNQQHALAGFMPNDLFCFGKNSDKEAMMNLMTSDEIIEELQKIAYQSNGLQKRLIPDDKENQYQLAKVQQLESRLKEVTKENETLIDELQDKKFEVYKFKNTTQTARDVYDNVEVILEEKIVDALSKTGNNKKQMSSIQKIITQTMSEFRSRIASESEMDFGSYQASLRKSASFKPLNYRKYLKKSESNSSESDKVQDHNLVSKSLRSPDNISMKTTNNIYDKSLKTQKPNLKHSYTAKKIKSKKSEGERVNIVPYNGYVPDYIQNEIKYSNK